jgi:hypothetical protein
MIRTPKRTEQLMHLSSREVIRDAANLKRGAAPTSSKSYERALARLGMTILSEQASELMPYLVGFQLLDKSDEGDFAAGFFVFDINGTIVDCPIFLIDGKVKGHQLLFLREQGLFMPNEPAIVQYIMTKHNQTLGEASYGEQTTRPNRNAPNFDMFSDRNRYLTKVSSYPEFYDRWARESGVLESCVSIFYDPRTAKVAELAKAEGKLPSADWISLLEQPKCAAMMYRWCEQSPRFGARIDKAIGSDWREKVAGFYRERSETVRKQAMSPLRGRNSQLQFGPATSTTQKFAAFSSPNGLAVGPGRELLADEYFRIGAVFFDEREGTLKKALIIEENSEGSWRSPLESGKYNVPMLNGDVSKLLVALPKNRIGCGDYQNASLLLDVPGRRAAMVQTADTAVQDDKQTSYSPDDFANSSTLKTDLPAFSPAGLEPEDVVVIFDSVGNVTEPLRILGGSEDGGFDIRFQHYCVQGISQPYGDSLGGSYRTHQSRSHIRPSSLVQNGKDGEALRVEPLGEEAVICVPPDAKVLKLKQDDSEYGSDAATFKIQSLSSLSDAAMRKFASFETERVTSNIVRINGRAMEQRKAAAFLMTTGIRKESAIDAVLSAGDRRKSYLIVPEDQQVSPWQAIARKIAIMRPDIGGDPDYQFSEPSEGLQGESDGHFPMPQQQGVSEQIRSDGMQMADTSQPPWSSENTPYSEAQTMGGGASSDGRESGRMARDPDAIFDNTLFSTLVGYANPSTDREKLFSGLLRACDDVGRSLFLTYAHGEEFTDAYGAEDAEDLENQLLRVQEASGKLLVMLLNRSIGDTNDLSLASLTDS